MTDTTVAHVEEMDTDFDFDFKLAIEVIARQKGLELTSPELNKLNERINGIFRESGVIAQTVSDVVDIAVNDNIVEKGLSANDLVAGERYVIRQCPSIHHKLRGKEVVFLGMSDNGRPSVTVDPRYKQNGGQTVELLAGPAALEKAIS